MKKLATIISRLFDPINVLAVIGVGAMVRSGNTQLLPVFIFGMVLPPIALLLWAVHTKRVNNWDVSNRHQRIRVLAAFTLLLLVDFLLMFRFGNEFLLGIFFLFVLWFAGFFLITLCWKISGHTSTLTLGLFVVYRWLGGNWWWLYLAIPAVAWARVAGKKHTVAEAIGGIVYSITFITFMTL